MPTRRRNKLMRKEYSRTHPDPNACGLNFRIVGRGAAATNEEAEL